MIIINNIDETYFELNGIRYFKNFTSVVAGNKLRILNVYDSKIELLALTDYTQITLGGVVYASVALLQAALLPVIYAINVTVINNENISQENELIEKGFHHIENFDWYVFAQVYRFNGVITENLVTDIITLDPSPTTTDFKRFDVIVFNDDFTFSVVKGAEGLNPAIPKIDIRTQIQLTVILVEANTTEPSYLTKQLMYDEGVGLPTEFTTTEIGNAITINNLEQASNGTKCIKVANPVNSDVLFLDKGEVFSSLGVDTISFKVKNATAGPWKFFIYSYNSIEAFYQGTVMIKGGKYGYDSQNTTDWQTIIVPMYDLFGGAEVLNTGFAITFFNNTGLTLYFDEFSLNGNFTQAPITSGISEAPIDNDYYVRRNAGWFNITTWIGLWNAGLIAIGLKEDTSNKQNSLTVDGTGAKYPTVDAVNAGLATKLNTADYNQHFKGKYLTAAAMRTAHPTANVGDSAQVNEVGATTVVNYSWDDELGDWVITGSVSGGATNTDELPEGSTNLYFTVARWLANLTKANIEAVYTGEITSHTHPTTGGISVLGQYANNNDAIANGLVTGNVYSLPYLTPGGFYPLAVVGTVVISEQMKSIIVSSSAILTDYPVYVNVYNTVGTDTTSNIYLNGKVRADWGDIRILNSSGVSIPFGIIKKEATVIKLVFSGSFAVGDNTFYIKYNKPQVAGNVTKFGVTTDQHYDSAETYVGRNLALARLDNFKARMAIYAPDAILEGGDKLGSVTTTASTCLSNMQLVTDKHNEIATTLAIPNYLWGWGNHDFENVSFAQVQTQYNGLLGQVAGNLYATWSDANYTYISLDAQYDSGTDTHKSNSHTGIGYVNPIQLTWLTNTLASATKPCIVFCHQLLSESDTERIFLTKETYHVSNRAAVRDILEASGKVIFVLAGHTHITSHNVINGIPYLNLVDLNEPSSETQHWDTPIANLNGRWGTIEIDRSALMIRFTQEVQVNTTVSTVYDFSIPYKTIYDNEYGNNNEKVFALSNLALYEKASIISDATDLYVNNDLYIVAKPASIYDSDPILSDKTIKIYGITSAANYGRAYFDFAPQTGKFKCKFSARLTSLSTKYLKLQKADATPIVGVYLGFKPDGNLVCLNATVSNVLFAYSLNTWYEFEIIADVVTKKFDVWINGTLYCNQYDWYSSTATPINQLEITSEIGNMFLDSFRIEQKAAAEPAILSIGTEEIIY